MTVNVRGAEQATPSRGLGNSHAGPRRRITGFVGQDGEYPGLSADGDGAIQSALTQPEHGSECGQFVSGFAQRPGRSRPVGQTEPPGMELFTRRRRCWMSIVKEFKEFAMRGNVVNMAVGIIIGAAFGKIVTSLVSNVVMPPFGSIIGGAGVSNLTLPIPIPRQRSSERAVRGISEYRGRFFNRGGGDLCGRQADEYGASPTPRDASAAAQARKTDDRDSRLAEGTDLRGAGEGRKSVEVFCRRVAR